MNHFSIKNLENDRHFQLRDNQIMTFDVWRLEIDCLQGLIWLTWPDGNDRVLQQGQSMSVHSKGVICVQAFAASSIITRIVKKGNSPFFFQYGRQIGAIIYWPLRVVKKINLHFTTLPLF
jgi:hypothetical protein